MSTKSLLPLLCAGMIGFAEAAVVVKPVPYEIDGEAFEGGSAEDIRLKIGAGNSADSAQSLERELEIFARAEKTMMINAPGFASAWETAKSAAHGELQDEERGKSLPKRIFRKFFGGSGNKRLASGETTELLELETSSDKSSN